jgi:hypothetical protein
VHALSIEAREFRWSLIEFKKGPVPAPRVYHSTSVLKTSKTNQIALLFGGRGKGNKCFNDLWYLSKEKSNTFRWNKINLETSEKNENIGKIIFELCLGYLKKTPLYKKH